MKFRTFFLIFSRSLSAQKISNQKKCRGFPFLIYFRCSFLYFINIHILKEVITIPISFNEYSLPQPTERDTFNNYSYLFRWVAEWVDCKSAKRFWVDFILTTGKFGMRVSIERDRNSYYLLQCIYLWSTNFYIENKWRSGNHCTLLLLLLLLLLLCALKFYWHTLYTRITRRCTRRRGVGMRTWHPCSCRPVLISSKQTCGGTRL